MPLSRRTLLSSGTALAALPLVQSTAAENTSEIILQRQYAPNRFGQLHMHEGRPRNGDNITHVPLVCFHQTPASGRTFSQLIPLMATDRVVMAVDTPGYGESDRPAYPVTISTYADGVADGLQTLGFGRDGKQFDILAYHTGCLIAVDVAVRYPSLVRRLVLTAVPYYADPEKRKASLAKIERWSFTNDPKRALDVWRSNVEKRAEGISLDQGIEQFIDRMKPGDKEWWGYEAVFNYDAVATLPKLAQPTAILNPHGALLTQTQDAARALPNAKFVDLPEVKHSVFQLNAHVIVQHARAFLDR